MKATLLALAILMAACSPAPASEPEQPDADDVIDDLCSGFGVSQPSDALANRRIEIFPFDTVSFGEEIDWSMDPYEHRSWRFRFHSLSWLRPYLGHAVDAEIARRVADVLDDWLENNPFDDPPSDYSWSDHSTARRAEVYVCARDMLDYELWVRALSAHADALADPDFYVDEGNHALDQDIALHKIGCVLQREDLMSLAEARMAELSVASIDEEGVTNEGAVAYQRYNYQRYGLAIAQLDTCDRQVPAGLERQKRMPVMLAHATRPDGRYEQIGDTFLSSALTIEGTVAEFAATQGEAGPKPERRVAVFNAGYVFGRSGWGEDRPFEEENFYSLRFGPAPINRWHRHADHTSLTWHPKGTNVLIDTGLEGYASDVYRFRYIKQPESQNVVVLRHGTILDDEGTRLIAVVLSDDQEYFHVAGKPYEGVERHRQLHVFHDPPLFVVRDDIRSSDSQVFDQLWHFHPDLTVTVNGSTARITGEDIAVEFVQLAAGQEMTMVIGQVDPYQGWASFSENERTPVPTLIASEQGTRVTFLTVVTATELGAVSWIEDELKIDVAGQIHTVRLTDPMHVSGR